MGSIPAARVYSMADVVKWLTHQLVALALAGSIPVRTVSRNTNDSLAQLVEHLTFNQRVAGSSPARVIILADVAELADALDLGSSA